MSEDSSAHFLNHRQKQLVGLALSFIAGAVILAGLVGIFLLLKEFLTYFSAVFLPLAIAGILAVLLRPVVLLIERRLNLNRIGSVALIYAGALVVVGGLGSLIVPALIGQVLELIRSLPSLIEEGIAFVDRAVDKVQNLDFLSVFGGGDADPANGLAATDPVEAKTDAPTTKAEPGAASGDPAEASDVLESNSLEAILGTDTYERLITEIQNSSREILTTLASALGAIASSTFLFLGALATYAVIPIYLAYLLSGNYNLWSNIESNLDFMKAKWRDDLIFLVKEFVSILVAYFRGQVIISLIQGTYLAIMYSVIDLRFGLLIGLLTGFLNVIPYIGTITGVLMALPTAYFQADGGFLLMLGAGLIILVGQLATDYFLVPKIIGKRTGMSEMLIIFSIFFWGTAFGNILGVILAVPLTAFFLVFWRLARERYLPKLVDVPEPNDESEPAPASG